MGQYAMNANIVLTMKDFQHALARVAIPFQSILHIVINHVCNVNTKKRVRRLCKDNKSTCSKMVNIVPNIEKECCTRVVLRADCIY